MIDASGAPPALEAAPDMTIRGGRVARGPPQGAPRLDPARQLVLYERSLIGSLGYAHDLRRRAAAMIASGSLDPEPLVSREIELAALPGQLEEMAATPVDVKVLVELAA